jgi:hypothetical protein
MTDKMEFFINGLRIDTSPIHDKEEFISLIVEEYIRELTAEAMRYGPGDPEYPAYIKRLHERRMFIEAEAEELRRILRRNIDRFQPTKDPEKLLDKIIKEYGIVGSKIKDGVDTTLSVGDGKHIFVRKDGELTYYFKGDRA